IVTSIRPDKSNKEVLWLSTANGIYSFNIKNSLLKRNFKCRNVKDSSENDLNIANIDVRNDTIWFTGKKGVGCYDISSGFYTIFPCKYSSFKKGYLNIKNLESKNDDEYYIGMTDRLPGIFNIKTHQYSFNFKINGDFPSLKIQKFTVDKKGNCWCLIQGQLFYATTNRNKFITLKITEHSSENNSTTAFKKLLYDKLHHCYYAAFDKTNKIFVFDENFKHQKNIPVVSHTSIITDIALDSSGNLWMAGDGLFLYNSFKNEMWLAQKLHPALKIPIEQFQNVAVRENYLYTISSTSSSSKIYKINTTTFLADSIPLPAMMLNKEGKNNFGVLEIDSKVNYAYLSNNRTLYQINLKNGECKLIIGLRFESFPFGFFSNYHWYEIDDNDNIWASTNGVIRIYDPKKLHVLKKFLKDRRVYLLQSANITHHAIMGFANSGGIELINYKNYEMFKLGLGDGLNTTRNSGLAYANNILFTGGELGAVQYLPLDTITNQRIWRKCFVSNIEIANQALKTDTLPEYLHKLKLTYDKNFLSLTFSSIEFEQPERLEYRYRLTGVDNEWVYADYLHRTISYPNLQPGNYTFLVSIKNSDGSWSDNNEQLNINIIPAWWQTSWFMFITIVSICLLIFLITRWRINIVRKEEQLAIKHEKELLELEAKALRAQMNPHFIFNCLNSIKALIQKKEETKAINYLTTFSKLIRTIFQNSDKREITLYDEIETCSLYTQLESMRFGNKFSYSFYIDETVDMKLLMVPALIIQPFIENAIWHGIMPKENEEGYVNVSVRRDEENICCIIDDNGIGRELSKQNKFKGEASTHQSKGVHLTQNRLNLDNLLNERNASVEIIDKKDAAGKAAGTKVILKFKEY
ncbi:MAG TPA: histidine kinase, partial [Panacibacter sp.]|nr:histidine kinase [Panacibacter sp.]